jgi:hypothetical protein
MHINGCVHRIVVRITVQVQAVDRFGVEVGGIVGRDKSAPLRAIVSSVAIVQAGVVIVVIATVTNGVGICNDGVGGFRRNRAVALGIIQIFPLYA